MCREWSTLECINHTLLSIFIRMTHTLLLFLWSNIITFRPRRMQVCAVSVRLRMKRLADMAKLQHLCTSTFRHKFNVAHNIVIISHIDWFSICKYVRRCLRPVSHSHTANRLRESGVLHRITLDFDYVGSSAKLFFRFFLFDFWEWNLHIVGCRSRNLILRKDCGPNQGALLSSQPN